jgi:protein-disulfide isomerase
MEALVADAAPRRGRWMIRAILGLAAFALFAAIVTLATQKPGSSVVRINGISQMQETFAGLPQLGDRLGSSDAPVTIQVFNDLQCSSCRAQFLSTTPGLVDDLVRSGDVQLLYRHYSVGENPTELGFYGAEAAAEQGYGWQYTYLFFRNQNEAERFGIDNDFLASIAGSIAELNLPAWQKALDEESGSDGRLTRILDSYDKLGTGLGIRARPAAIVSGPNGTETLQDGPTLAQIESAVDRVN